MSIAPHEDVDLLHAGTFLAAAARAVLEAVDVEDNGDGRPELCAAIAQWNRTLAEMEAKP